MTHGGKRDGAGRKKGVSNKKTQIVEEILGSIGCNPLQILADIAIGKPMKADIGLNAAGDDYAKGEVRPTLDQRMSAAKELAQYVYPKRKAVEHSGSLGTYQLTKEQRDAAVRAAINADT